MDLKNLYKEYDGIDVNTFTLIPFISCYNSNYYMGLKRKGYVTKDLLYVISNDDNISFYYHIDGSSSTFIGYSFTDQDIFNLEESEF